MGAGAGGVVSISYAAAAHSVDHESVRRRIILTIDIVFRALADSN